MGRHKFQQTKRSKRLHLLKKFFKETFRKIDQANSNFCGTLSNRTLDELKSTQPDYLARRSNGNEIPVQDIYGLAE